MDLIFGILTGKPGNAPPIYLQRLAVSIGTFFAGSYGLVNLMGLTSFRFEDENFLAVPDGCFLEAILASGPLNWAEKLLLSFSDDPVVVLVKNIPSQNYPVVGFIFPVRDQLSKPVRKTRTALRYAWMG